MRGSTISLIVVSFSAVLFVCSCAPFATYPPVEGSVGINNPNLEPVPSIMADAIWHVHREYGEGREEFAINLPDGTPARVYEKVLYILGRGRPMTAEGEWAYHVVQVRARGLDAQADVIVPRTDGPAGLVTVKLRKDFDEYSVVSTKVWNFPADVPPPAYAPPQEQRIAGEEGAQ